MSDTKKKIVITPETHWDREWYLPFQEYRAKFVQLMDQLLDIYEKDPTYANFTLDGQTVPLEDYLEVRPKKEPRLRKAIKEGRLSIGPCYILPDEYIISGESMIRNLLLGTKLSRKYDGIPMKAGYIPDPFGHFAQMPQILAGFDIPSILFARGFDDSYEKLGLNMEFIWDAPGKAASIVGIHLVQHYGNCAHLNTKVDPNSGKYENALSHIHRVVEKFKEHTITDAIILNNGSDHLFAQPEIPEIVRQWNERYGESEGIMEQADFERYTQLVLEDIKKRDLKLKHYEGELHGGKYNYLLSGVFSARMWIKQWNKLCENRLTRYAEPLSTISWLNGTSKEDERDYLWLGWKWLMKNHPHDSICGCSVDHVHDIDMKTRFAWSEQIALEIFKNAAIDIAKIMPLETNDGEKFPVMVYNPSPRARTSIVSVPVIMDKHMLEMFPPDLIAITDKDENPVYNFVLEEELEDRYQNIEKVGFSVNFIAESVPAFGLKTFYVLPGEDSELKKDDLEDKVIDGKEGDLGFIENKYYKIVVNKNGSFDLHDKKTGITHANQGILEDVGDWGDEYDFSWAKEDQEDTVILSTAHVEEINITNMGNLATIRISYLLELPIALSEDRKSRSSETTINPVEVYVTLNSAEKTVFIDCIIENNAMDHRMRMLFSSDLKSDQVSADGHFYVVPRPVDTPKVENWSQDPVPTKNQHDFVSVSDGNTSFTVLNLGLPEYAPVRKEDGTVGLAITLFRSVGWLSRGDFATRTGNAGPDLSTPGAQCLGINECNLGITTGEGTWLDAKAHIIADRFNNPLQVISPMSLRQSMRQMDAFLLGTNLDTYPEVEKRLQLDFSTLELEGDAFLISAYKRAEYDSNGIIIRVTNMASETQE